MVSKKIALITVAILSCPIHSMAQQKETNTSMVEHKAGVVTYYPAKMGFSPNDNLGAVFNSITRYGNVTSYTLMVNGEDYFMDSSIFYSSTLVADIERIEIITDQSLMGAKVGTNGYINVVLREREEGTHGQVGFEMDTKKNHTPIASISHKKDKWTVWGRFVGDISRNEIEAEAEKYGTSEYFYKYTYSTSKDETFTSRKENNNVKYRYKYFNVGTSYKNGKNEITLEFNGQWNSTRSHGTMIVFSNTIHNYDEDKRYDTLMTFSSSRSYSKDDVYIASINWRHTVNEKLSFRVNTSEEISKHPYESANIFKSYSSSIWGPDSKYESYSITGFTRPDYSYVDTKNYRTDFGVQADFKPTNELGIKGGVLGYVYNTKNNDESPRYRIPYTSYNTKTQVMPYILAQYSVGQFLFSAGERFSFYNTEFSHNDTIHISRFVINPTQEQSDVLTVKNSYNESVTNASVAWTPCNSHMLIASYMRQNHKSYIYHNSYNYRDLTAKINDYPVDMKYDIFDFGYSYTGQNINAGVKAKYIKYNTDESGLRTYYENSRSSSSYRIGFEQNIYFVSASAAYNSNMFSIIGDLEFKSESEITSKYITPELEETETVNSSTGNIWTLRLTPMVRLPYDINVSATAAFQSIKTRRYALSNEMERGIDKWLTLRASKAWKNFDFYVKWENALYKKEHDEKFSTYVSSRYSSETLDLYNNNKHQSSVTFGGCWRF